MDESPSRIFVRKEPGNRNSQNIIIKWKQQKQFDGKVEPKCQSQFFVWEKELEIEIGETDQQNKSEARKKNAHSVNFDTRSSSFA